MAFLTNPSWPLATTVVALVVMALETLLSRANERKLRAQGAVEPSADAAVYRMMQWAYPGAFIAMGAEGALIGPGVGAWTWIGVALFVLAKALKYWTIATLGHRWSFRVLVLPGVPPIRRGPYAVVRHPNYVAVIGE